MQHEKRNNLSLSWHPFPFILFFQSSWNQHILSWKSTCFEDDFPLVGSIYFCVFFNRENYSPMDVAVHSFQTHPDIFNHSAKYEVCKTIWNHYNLTYNCIELCCQIEFYVQYFAVLSLKPKLNDVGWLWFNPCHTWWTHWVGIWGVITISHVYIPLQ